MPTYFPAVGLYLFMLVYSYYRELADEAEEASRVFQDSMVTSRSGGGGGGGSIMNLNMRVGGGAASSRNVYAPEPTPGASIFPMQAAVTTGFPSKAPMAPMMPPMAPQQMEYPMSTPTPIMAGAVAATPDLNAPPPAYNYGGYYCPE